MGFELYDDIYTLNMKYLNVSEIKFYAVGLANIC